MNRATRAGVLAAIGIWLSAAAVAGAPGTGAVARKDWALTSRWQNGCLAELRGAVDEAKRIEPKFLAHAEYRQGLEGPGLPDWPGLFVSYSEGQGDERRSLNADVVLSSSACCRETGWRLKGPHGPLNFDQEPPPAELEMLTATRKVKSGLILTVYTHRMPWPTARPLIELFRATLDRCATAMPPSLGARIIDRGGVRNAATTAP